MEKYSRTCVACGAKGPYYIARCPKCDGVDTIIPKPGLSKDVISRMINPIKTSAGFDKEAAYKQSNAQSAMM